MDAFLTLEGWNPIGARSDRLAAAQFNADSCPAILAQLRVAKNHVIGVTRRRLHFPAEQQCILVGDQQLTVERDGWPTAPV